MVFWTSNLKRGKCGKRYQGNTEWQDWPRINFPQLQSHDNTTFSFLSFFFLSLLPTTKELSRVRMENPEIKFPSLRAATAEPEKLESGTFTFDELTGFPLRGRREIRRDKDDPLSRWNFRVVRKGTFNECRTMGTAGVDYPRLDVYLEKRDKRQTCCSGEPTFWKNARQL